MVFVLFVCMANICRSPAAEAVLRHLSKQHSLKLDLTVNSCGISALSVGQLPDRRMAEAALKRGIALESRASAFTTDFYDRADYILAVDHKVLNLLLLHAPKRKFKAKITLISEYSKNFQGQEIKDPYIQSANRLGQAFDMSLDILEDCCHGLLCHLAGHK